MQKHKEKTPMSQGESRASHPLPRSPQKDRAVAFQHCLFSSLDSIHSELATHQNHPPPPGERRPISAETSPG